jgi:hypothetical protein
LLDPIPDPHLKIGFGSGYRRKKGPPKIEKGKEISCFEVPDVLFSELRAFPVAWDVHFRGLVISK